MTSAWRLGWLVVLLAAIAAGAAHRRVAQDMSVAQNGPVAQGVPVAEGFSPAGVHVGQGGHVAQGFGPTDGHVAGGGHVGPVAQGFSPAGPVEQSGSVAPGFSPAKPRPGDAPRTIADLWLGSRPVVRTVEGNLVDLNCYVEHAGVGPGHVHCARACAEKGMPLALLDTAGRLFVVSGPGHVDPRTLNAPLLEHLERTVRVTGLFFDHEDVKLVAVERVERADRQAPIEEVLRRYRGPRR